MAGTVPASTASRMGGSCLVGRTSWRLNDGSRSEHLDDPPRCLEERDGAAGKTAQNDPGLGSDPDGDGGKKVGVRLKATGFQTRHPNAPRGAARWCLAAIFMILQAAAFGQAAPQSQADVEAEAVRLSPEILAARQHVAEANAKVAEMEGHRRFGVTLSGLLGGSSGRVAEPASDQSFWTTEADLVAPIPNLGRTGAETAEAAEELRAAQAQLLSAQLDVGFKASQVFLEYWRATDSLAIATENLAQATSQAEDTQKRIDVGDVPAADILKAQVQVAQAQAAQQRAKVAIASASAAVNSLLLRNLDAQVNLANPSPPDTSPLQSSQVLATALAHSPDLASAQADVHMAQAALRVAKHARDTDLSLQLSHARTSDPTAYSNLTTLSLNFSLPLTDGGVAAAQIKQAQAALAHAQASLEALKRQVSIDVTQAVLDVEGDQANLVATEQVEKIAQESLVKAQQEYNAGLTTTRDVLEAQLVYSQARVEANSARYDLAIARAHLKQLAGGSLP